MSGSVDLLVDTNMFIYLFEGNQSAGSSLTGKNIYYSFITELELIGVPGITEFQKKIVSEVLNDGIKIMYSESIARIALEIKQAKHIKIPDAIIAASAIDRNLPLITADQDFDKIPGLSCILFDV